jgi:hypothetical protein
MIIITISIILIIGILTLSVVVDAVIFVVIVIVAIVVIVVFAVVVGIRLSAGLAPTAKPQCKHMYMFLLADAKAGTIRQSQQHDQRRIKLHLT